MSVVDIIKSKDIKDYLDLSRQPDGTYRSCCPIHGGSNPTSFALFPNNNLYCFACGFTGGLIQFVMERDGITFHQAVIKLADEYSLDIDSDETYKKQNSIAEQNERMVGLFTRELPTIIDYLYKRGFTDDTIKEYQIGWSTKSKTLVIPMRDMYGRVATFLQRYFNSEPKYKNGINNELFTKDEFLFNIPNSQKLLKKTKRLYVVEGALDAISAYQQGEAAVAYSGVTFSKHHVKLIREITERIEGVEIIIVPDNDGRADKFVKRGRDLFHTHYPQVDVRVAVIGDE